MDCIYFFDEKRTIKKYLEKLDRWQPTGKMSAGYIKCNGEDPKIFRKRKQKSCFCGWHSCGKKQLTRHSSYTRYSIRLLRIHKLNFDKNE